jgi:hypothetical protein
VGGMCAFLGERATLFDARRRHLCRASGIDPDLGKLHSNARIPTGASYRSNSWYLGRR